MASSSYRERIRQSERAHGHNTALGSQAWAARGGSGSRSMPTRSARLPTPLPVPPPTPLTGAWVDPSAAAAAQAAMLQAEAEAGDQADEDDQGNETDPYELAFDEDLDGGDDQGGDPQQQGMRILELESEVAHLRVELARACRLRNRERELQSAARGPYWTIRSPVRRRL